MASFPVKLIVAESDVRRVPGTLQNCVSDIRQFARSIQGLSGEQCNDGFSLRYEDDEGDEITLSSNDELQEAVTIAQSLGRKSLRLKICQSQPQSSSFVHIQQPSSPPQSPPQSPKPHSSHSQNNDEFLDDDDASSVFSMLSVGSMESDQIISGPNQEEQQHEDEFELVVSEDNDSPPQTNSCTDLLSSIRAKHQLKHIEAPPPAKVVFSPSRLLSSEIRQVDDDKVETRKTLKRVQHPTNDTESAPPEKQLKHEPPPPPPPQEEEEEEEKFDLMHLIRLFVTDPACLAELPQAAQVLSVQLRDGESLASGLERVFAVCPRIRLSQLVQTTHGFQRFTDFLRTAETWLRPAVELPGHTIQAILQRVVVYCQVPAEFEFALRQEIQHARRSHAATLSMPTSTQTETRTPPTTVAQPSQTDPVHPEDDSRVVHRGIVCDGCEMAPIVGVRFRCTVRPDFDLCSGCEATKELHQELPMLKIRQPLSLDQGPMWHGGPMPRPWQQHQFQHQHHHNHHRNQSRKHHQRQNQPTWYQQPPHCRPRPIPPPCGRPRADFVRDVTIADRSMCLPGQTLIKTWLVRNPGSQAWPQGTSLVFVQGDKGIVDEVQHHAVARCRPAQQQEVSVAFTTPHKPGRYVLYFRLEAADQKKFGQRIWLDFVVVPETDQAAQFAIGAANADTAQPLFKQPQPPQAQNQSSPIVDTARASPAASSGFWWSGRLQGLASESGRVLNGCRVRVFGAAPGGRLSVGLVDGPRPGDHVHVKPENVTKESGVSGITSSVSSMSLDQSAQEPPPDFVTGSPAAAVEDKSDEDADFSLWSNPPVPTAFAFQTQLQALLDMGFNDECLVRDQLEQKNGSVDAVVNWLLAQS